MPTITLEISDELLGEIESEANDLGYSTRSEYIRHLLQHRSHTRSVLSPDGDTEPLFDSDVVESHTEQIKTLAAKLEDTVDRVEELEAKIERRPTDIKVKANSITNGSATEQNTSPSTEISELEDWLAEKIDDHPSKADSIMNEPANEQNISSSPALSELEDWLAEHGPDNDNAVAIIKEAAIILSKEGPLNTGELKRRLYQTHPNAYASKEALWGATVERVYEDAPGFTRPKFGTYDFH